MLLAFILIIALACTLACLHAAATVSHDPTADRLDDAERRAEADLRWNQGRTLSSKDPW